MNHCSKVLKIHRITTSPYRPQSNAVCERFHRVLNDSISKQIMLTNDEKSWDLYLPHILSAYRTTPHETTQLSPHFLLYKTDPVLPIDTLLKPRLKYVGDEPHKLALQRQHIAFTIVRKRLRQAQDKRNAKLNVRAKPVNFSIGDAVYVHNTRRSSKLDPKWCPYYRILKQNGPVTFLVKNQLDGSTKQVHAAHLKLAKLDNWKLPQSNPEIRKAKLAIAPNTSDSESDEQDDNFETITPVRNNAQLHDSESSSDSEDDVPLSSRKRLRYDSDTSIEDEDDLPLSKLRKLWSDNDSDCDMSDEDEQLPNDQLDNDNSNKASMDVNHVLSCKSEKSHHDDNAKYEMKINLLRDMLKYL